MRLRAILTAMAVAAAVLHGEARAVTSNAPVQPGDTFFVLNQLNGFSQIQGNARVGNSVTYAGNNQLGGVYADATGLYLAGNPGGTGLTVERIPIGGTTSSILLGPADLVGGGTGGVPRDVAVTGSGTIFVVYTTGAVDRFTPAGGGTYTRSAVGTFTGFTGADLGDGHQLSIANNGNYLVTSSRTQNRVWSMNANDGTVQQWNVPTGLLGPVSAAQLRPSAESAIDPVRPNRIIVPMGNDGLYEVDFDPATGAFPTAAPRRLSNDTVAAFVDAVGFDAAGDLSVSLRDTASIGSLREFTQAELAAASAGTSPITIFNRAAYYTGADARIARDIAVVVPEPASAAGLVAAATLGLLARRRRRSS